MGRSAFVVVFTVIVVRLLFASAFASLRLQLAGQRVRVVDCQGR